MNFPWGAKSKLPRWVLAGAVGGIAVLGFWWGFSMQTTGQRGAQTSAEPGAGAAPGEVGSDAYRAGTAPELQNVSGDPVALRYMAAFQQGAWGDIVDMTCWMQERLTRVKIETGSDAAREDARAELLKRTGERKLECNRLRPEGIEDQYVFANEAKLDVIALDAGRGGLEQPAKDRTWIRVTYPSRRTALRDDKGIPIRSVIVGVNVSDRGMVLKASVIGNLDIDRKTISYDWETNSRVE